MKTLVAQTQIGQDGKLHLDLETDLPPGPAEVVVVSQASGVGTQPPFDTLKGIFAGRLPADIDIDADLCQMNAEWERSIEPSPE